MYSESSDSLCAWGGGWGGGVSVCMFQTWHALSLAHPFLEVQCHMPMSIDEQLFELYKFIIVRSIS